MITGFHHVVIAVRELAAGVTAYETLLNREATSATEHNGIATALITTSNISVELMAPVGESDKARRLSAVIKDGGEGLKSIVFEAADIAHAHRRFERVGLAPEAITERGSFRLLTGRTHGVRIFVMSQRAEPIQVSSVTGLDHIVIRTSDAERAAALYGARLGLDMRLDREVRGARLMFFRCGDAVVEVAHDLTIEDGFDRVWGLSWRTADADLERVRLVAAGLDVSEVRAGVKPGTRVFSVRSGTVGVPTLMIEHAPR